MKKITKKLISIAVLFSFFITFGNYVKAMDDMNAGSPSEASTVSFVSNDTVDTTPATIASPKSVDSITSATSFINNNQTDPVVIVQSDKPIIISGASTTITTTGATLNGSVNPNGLMTQAWFEVQNRSSSLSQNIGSGNLAVNLTPFILTGLSPNTTYNFRIAALNTDGTTFGNWTSFTTLSNNGGGGGGGYIVATVDTGNATNITTNSATLNGVVYHSNSNTTTWFQYSASSNLLNYNETYHASIGWTSASVPLNSSVTGLYPNTVYYFRIVANANGTTKYGNIYSFKTSPIIVIAKDQNYNEQKKQIIINEKDPVNQIEQIDQVAQPEQTTQPITINPNNQNFSANALYSFLPTTTFQWILLLILILGIIFLSRKIYLNMQKDKQDKNINANHIDNLPT